MGSHNLHAIRTQRPGHNQLRQQLPVIIQYNKEYSVLLITGREHPSGCRADVRSIVNEMERDKCRYLHKDPAVSSWGFAGLGRLARFRRKSAAFVEAQGF